MSRCVLEQEQMYRKQKCSADPTPTLRAFPRVLLSLKHEGQSGPTDWLLGSGWNATSDLVLSKRSLISVHKNHSVVQTSVQ